MAVAADDVRVQDLVCIWSAICRCILFPEVGVVEGQNPCQVVAECVRIRNCLRVTCENHLRARGITGALSCEERLDERLIRHGSYVKATGLGCWLAAPNEGGGRVCAQCLSDVAPS